MSNRLIKFIRVTLWIAIGFCILNSGYQIYTPIRYMDYDSISVEQKSILWLMGILVFVSMIFMVIFFVRIKSNLLKGRFFIKNNYLCIVVLALCTFIMPWANLAYMCLGRYNDIWYHGFNFIPAAIFGHGASYNSLTLLLIIFAMLYKIGEQVSEEQRLTI